MSRWDLDTVRWDRFDPALVDRELLALARGACLVEYNADAYTDYLSRVFGDDAGFRERIQAWGEEEKQHGLALKRWVEMADPDFRFEHSLCVFRAAYQQLPNDGSDSVRGSRARELVARCIVESGTASFYSALRDTAGEPVFKEICSLVALDEVRHFNLFRKALEARYAREETLGRLSRLKVVVARVFETSDEELCFAYRAGNFPDEPIEPARIREYSRDYMQRITRLYQPEHFRLGLGLAMKASGIDASQRSRTILGHVAHHLLRIRYQAMTGLAHMTRDVAVTRTP